MSAIAGKDWLEFRRDSRLLVASVVVVLMALGAALASAVQVARHEADRTAAAALDRATWEGQGARNPHSAAHFATWAFRPLTTMAVLDPGVTPYAGSAIWMEAHARNASVARPVADSSAGGIGAGFSLAFILQTILPLLLFGIAAGMVTRERERGTLRLLLAGGAEPRRLVGAKALGLARVAALLALPVLAGGLVGALAAGPADLPRLLLWAGAHGLFLLAMVGLGLAVSAAGRQVTSALLLLAGLWLMMVVAVPRLNAYGTPSPFVFQLITSENSRSERPSEQTVPASAIDSNCSVPSRTSTTPRLARFAWCLKIQVPGSSLAR